MELEYDNDGTKYLRGHIAKVNPQSKLLQEEPGVLAIFQSPVNHYISSSWYEKPNAPTWNYMSVHVYGKVSILEGEALWQSVERLVKRYEKDSAHPVSLATLPQPVQGMLQAVTGFEIKVDKFEAAFKLSQNRNPKDHQNIIAELEKLNTPLAKAMAEALNTHKP
jgi:transcriptional regulator